MVTVSKGADIPLHTLEDREVARLIHSLTIQPYSYGKEQVEPIKNYKLISKKGIQYLRMPIAYGEEYADSNQLPIKYDLVTNKCTYPRQPDPNHPDAPDGQDVLFREVTNLVRGYASCLVESPTGSGKTVTALNTVAELQTTCLVLVPSEVIMNQWIVEIEKNLGLSKDGIGIIQGNTCRWARKRIVVGIIHNVVQKKYESSFYKHFGMVVWDEADILGARWFSKSMFLFPSKYKLAMTATPERKDGASTLIFNYFGNVGYKGKVKALPCKCKVVEYWDTPDKHVSAMNKSGFPRAIMLKMLSKDHARNKLIVDIACGAISMGRKILVMSDSIEHLQTLQQMALKKLSSLKPEESGLFVGSYKDGGKTIKTPQHYLTDIRTNSSYKVVWATYGMMTRGVDIKYLDAGMDATPRGSGVQVIGRIRRPYENKKLSVWFTIVDRKIFSLVRLTKKRVEDFMSCGVRVKY